MFSPESYAPVILRAWRRARTSALSFSGVVALSVGIGLVSAFFVLPAQPTWAERALSGVAIAAISLLILVGLPFLWHVWTYWRTRGLNEWQITAQLAGNGVQFALRRNPEAMPESFGNHGVIECHVELPNGVVHAYQEPLDRGADLLVQVLGNPPQHGHYKVRWCGSYGRSRPFLKRYALAQTSFDLWPEDEGRPGGIVGP